MTRARRVEIGLGGAGFDVFDVGSGVGPVVTVLGGVHGDEAEGMLAAAKLVGGLDDVVRGTVRIVPVCNEAAAARGIRAWTEVGGDLARAFPGDPGGSLVERLAHHLGQRVIEGSDLLIDLHSAGVDHAMLHLAGAPRGVNSVSARSEAAARSLGMPTLWLHDDVAPGRTLSHALDHGIPAVYVEHPGGSGIDITSVERTVDGVVRVLAEFGMVPASGPTPVPERILVGNGDLDANNVRSGASGMLWPMVDVGVRVDRGDPIAEVLALDGSRVAVVSAASAGTVVMLRRSVHVVAGDRIATITTEVS